MRLCRKCGAPVVGHRSLRYCKDECREAARKQKVQARMLRPGMLVATKRYMHEYKSTPEHKARRKELRAARKLSEQTTIQEMST